MIARLLTVAVLAANMTSPLACSREPDRVPCPPDVAAPFKAADTPVFRFRVCGTDGQVVPRKVQLSVLSFNHDGTHGKVSHPVTGEQHRSPMVMESVRTPFSFELRPLPGIAMLEMKVVYLGQQGEQLECWIERTGLPLRGSHGERPVAVAAGGSRGAAELSCVFLV